MFNDVQLSLDKAVDDYYAQLAEKSTLGLILSGKSQKTALENGGLLDQLATKLDFNQGKFITLDSMHINDVNEVKIFTGKNPDSVFSSFYETTPFACATDRHIIPYN